MQNVYDEILNYFGNEIAYVDTTSVYISSKKS